MYNIIYCIILQLFMMTFGSIPIILEQQRHGHTILCRPGIFRVTYLLILELSGSKLPFFLFDPFNFIACFFLAHKLFFFLFLHYIPHTIHICFTGCTNLASNK